MAYEVFRVKIDPPSEKTVGGNLIKSPGGLRWPPNAAFGFWAWTFFTGEEALKRYRALEGEPLSGDSDVPVRV